MFIKAERVYGVFIYIPALLLTHLFHLLIKEAENTNYTENNVDISYHTHDVSFYII